MIREAFDPTAPTGLQQDRPPYAQCITPVERFRRCQQYCAQQVSAKASNDMHQTWHRLASMRNWRASLGLPSDVDIQRGAPAIRRRRSNARGAM